MFASAAPRRRLRAASTSRRSFRSGSLNAWLGHHQSDQLLLAPGAAEEARESLELLGCESDRIVGRGGEPRGGVEQDQLRAARRVLRRRSGAAADPRRRSPSSRAPARRSHRARRAGPRPSAPRRCGRRRGADRRGPSRARRSRSRAQNDASRFRNSAVSTDPRASRRPRSTGRSCARDRAVRPPVPDRRRGPRRPSQSCVSALR